VVEGHGGNAHGKLMAKWIAIGRYVGMMTSRWAPVQDPGECFLCFWGLLGVAGWEVLTGFRCGCFVQV